MTTVLALDIAARASGAAFDGPGGMPKFSTLKQDFRAPDYGPVGTKFRVWLLDLIILTAPDHIAFEAPWVASGDRQPSHPTDPSIPRVLLGLAFLAEQIADEVGIPTTELAVSTARKHFVGHGRPKKPKEVVIARCRQLGWRVKNDHEADAAAVWSYSKAILEPRWAPRSTPLFAGAR